MRICFIGSFTAGGTESACFNVANELAINNEVIVLSTSGQNKTFYLASNILFINLHSKSIIKRNIEIYYILKRYNIDVCITLEAMTGLFASIPTILSKCKLVIWEHANYFQDQGSKYIQIIRQIELYIADAYVVLTKRDLNNFKKHFYVKAHLDYIYNIAYTQDNHLYDSNSKIIISVGHIRKIKNFIVIPEIGRIVFKKHPDWKWLIYGDPVGLEYEAIHKKILDYKLEENIIFAGRTNRIENEYRKSSIYVMTSLQEGLPMVLLEAKTQKLPLISFNIETGPDEIIKNGVNGFLIEPYDVELMAERICFLIDNDQVRLQFSEKSAEGLNSFFAEDVISKWMKLLNGI